MATYDKTLFVFRRDLRLDDNTALLEASRDSERVIPCFIVDPRQVEDNEYRSALAIQFMVESLEDLDDRLENGLNVFYGEAADVIERLIEDHDVDALYLNRDYTPFSVARDEAIRKACGDAGVDFHSFDDATIHAPGSVLKDDGDPYTVFTPFWKRAREVPVRKPVRYRFTNALGVEDDLVPRDILARAGIEEDRNIAARGGREHALRTLRGLKDYENYSDIRDFPAENGTTLLSPYLKFGCCSAREVVYAVRKYLGNDHPLERQLFWRDFFTQIAWHFPSVFGKEFQEKYQALPWQDDDEAFAAWCEGRTGFPLVDAGMRELNQTGYMHNRVRMVVASFLTKDLHIDWRRGERYFAQRLVDYDPAVNNGSWQWAASTGCDAQPYFRIFNPWLQQKKFDADATYIKLWVPELRDLEPSRIHKLDKDRPDDLDYPEPMVDHREESARAKDMFSDGVVS